LYFDVQAILNHRGLGCELFRSHDGQVVEETPASSKLERASEADEGSMNGNPEIDREETGAKAPAAAEPRNENASRSRAGIGPWSRDLLISVVVSLFIILFLYQPVRVEGTSMLPVLEDQDRLFINKFAYHFGEIHRGDVVVFLYPHDETKSYIKRVIGLPGDQLKIDHGSVWLNGKELVENYVPLKYEDDRSLPTMTVPAGDYFVMGDHRSISSDSRDFGPVPRGLIYGRAAFVYWPVDQAGVVR
jgi:signal peptidase I